jgi:hypothetical protein
MAKDFIAACRREGLLADMTGRGFDERKQLSTRCMTAQQEKVFPCVLLLGAMALRSPCLSGVLGNAKAQSLIASAGIRGPVRPAFRRRVSRANPALTGLQHVPGTPERWS